MITIKEEFVGGVYFIADPSGAMKIGRARNPVARLRELQTGNPSRLSLVGVWNSSPELSTARERELHGYFASSRIRGEWYRLTADQIELVLAVMDVRFAAPHSAFGVS